MSWLGKILALLVLITSVIWASLTVNAYVTRTNWKVRADAYQASLKTSEDNRVAEQRQWQAEKEQYVRLLDAEKSRSTKQQETIADLSAASKAGEDEFKKIQAVVTATANVAAKKDASATALLSELDDTRKRNAVLEDRLVDANLKVAAADRAKLQSANEANLQRAIAQDNADKVAVLQNQVTELRQAGGASGSAAVLRSIEKIAPPVADNTRGTVLSVSGDLVRISIGIDAGLEAGSRLDVFRESEGKYLGTLVVQGTSLRPKEAVAVFKSASGRQVSQLRADDLPRAKDNVGIVR